MSQLTTHTARLFLILATVALTAVLMLALPQSVEAQGGWFQAAQCGNDGQPACQLCHIVQIGNTIITWLIGVLFIIFAVIVVIAGFKLVISTGNPDALQTAKSRFINALVGLALVFAAWLIVDTLMRALLRGGEGMIDGRFFWAEVQCLDIRTPTAGTPDEFYLTEQASGNDFQTIQIEDTELIAAGLASTERTEDMPPLSDPPASNCGVDESSLVQIPGEGGHRAIPSVVSRYLNMRNAASSRGINLSVTSSYRPDSRQTELWDQCPRCQAEGTVARPCSRGGNGSRHSSGVALDISSAGGRAGRCEVVNLCRSAGASFIMMYGRSDHVHCDWGGTRGEANVSC